MERTFSKLIQQYNKWLDALNYDKRNAKIGIGKINDFFTFLKNKGHLNPLQVPASLVELYFFELSNRISPITGESFSVNTIKSYRMELARFSRFLMESKC